MVRLLTTAMAASAASAESHWSDPPKWDNKPETWEKWTGRIYLWADSIDDRQKSTLASRLVRSLEDHPSLYEIARQVPRDTLIDPKDGLAAVLTAIKDSGLVRRVPADVAAKLRELLGPSMRRKPAEGMVALGIRFQKLYGELGEAVKLVDDAVVPKKLFHPVIQGVLLLEYSGLNPSEVSAVLGPQGNKYDWDSVLTGLTEQWPDQRLFLRDKDLKHTTKSHSSHYVEDDYLFDEDQWCWWAWDDGPGEWSFAGFEDDQTDTWASQSHDSWSEGPDQSWSGASEEGWQYEPNPLNSALAAIEDGSIIEIDASSEAPSSTELQLAAAAYTGAQRSFQEARDILNQVRTARGYYPVVGLAAIPSFGNSDGGKSGSKDKGFGKGKLYKGLGKSFSPSRGKGFGKSKSKGFAGKSKGGFKGPRECFLCGADHLARDCPRNGKGPGKGKSGGSGLVGFALMAITDESALATSLLDDYAGFGIWDIGATSSMSGIQGLEAIRASHLDRFGKADFQIDSCEDNQLNFTFADGGGSKAMSKVSFGHPMLGTKIKFLFSCFDYGQRSPTLLGLDVVRALGAIPDVEAGTVYSKKLKAYLPTVKLPSGHLAWDLRVPPPGTPLTSCSPFPMTSVAAVGSSL